MNIFTKTIYLNFFLLLTLVSSFNNLRLKVKLGLFNIINCRYE